LSLLDASKAVLIVINLCTCQTNAEQFGDITVHHHVRTYSQITIILFYSKL